MVNDSGGSREFGGFRNAADVRRCGDDMVVSDVEGELFWLNDSPVTAKVDTGAPGRAIACSDEGVWFLDARGYLANVAKPAAQ